MAEAEELWIRFNVMNIPKVIVSLTINKIQQIQTYSNYMDNSRSLETMLRSHTISPQEFFQTQGIVQQIRNNLDKFIKYCRSHRAFTRRMIVLALNISYSDLENVAIKTASHAITQVLSNEEEGIAELFFEQEAQTSRRNSENLDIPEELEGGIQSEAQRLFKFDDQQEEPPQQQRPVELQKNEIAALSLEILHQPERNATCLGHLQKIYSFLIRHNPFPVLQYFQQNTKALELLLSNLQYSSVSSFVAQLLTSEDKTRQYVHEGLKKKIIQYVIEEMFRKIQEEDFFDGVMILVEEILNTTKQSYYEYFQDFKRVSNLLVNHQTMSRFLNVILTHKEKSFRSASKFLEFLFNRINTQREDNSYYHRGQETQPSMNFQVDIFFKNIPNLIEQITRIQSFQSLTKISYLSFLESLMTCAKSNNVSFSLQEPSFIGLLDCFSKQQKSGIFKNKLYSLITAIIGRASSEEANKFLQTNDKVWEQYFTSIKSANYTNTKIYNKNESSAFDIGLISQLSKKNESVIQNASKAIGKDFKRICKKYQTKIASFQNPSFPIEQDSNFEPFRVTQFQPQEETNKSQNNSVPLFSLNLVGKNSISIPILQLPDRSHSQEDSKERKPEREQGNSPSGSGRNEVIEIQEVVSLTDSIKSLTFDDREQSQIQRPPELQKNLTSLSDSSQKVKQGQNQPNEAIQKEAEDKKLIVKLKDKTENHTEQARFFAKHLAIFA